MNKTHRIQKILANLGLGSRREIETWIKAGIIKVNGITVTELGTKIDPTTDKILVHGKPVTTSVKHVYYWLNKPIGVVSSRVSQIGEPTVVSLVPQSPHVYPVGRLDKDSHGLILLTNDGELTHRLTHPKYHVPKSYLVQVEGQINLKILSKLRTGIKLSDGITAPAEVIWVKRGNPTVLKFVLHEGRFHQIRRMCGAVGLKVTDLERIMFSDIKIDNLKIGKYRPATEEEIISLRQAVKLI